MTFEIETPSRTRSVQVAPGPGGYVITIDGREQVVDAVPVGGAAWSILVGGRSYDVGVVERGAGELTVHVNGRAVPVRLGERRHGRRRAASPADTGTGPHVVAAPMPGRVVKVLVKAGDRVQARQGLVVIEAMKMENELRAVRAGVVAEVRVAEGAPVEANTVLVVIE